MSPADITNTSPPHASTSGTESPLQDRKISSSAEPQPNIPQSKTNEEDKSPNINNNTNVIDENKSSQNLPAPNRSPQQALLPLPDPIPMTNGGLLRPPLVNDFKPNMGGYQSNNVYQPRMRPPIHTSGPNIRANMMGKY